MLSAIDGDGLFDLTMRREPPGLARLGDWVDHVAKALALGPTTAFRLRLCLEEVVANLVMHGVPVEGADGSQLRLSVTAAGDALRVVVEDRCRPFNPMAAPNPDRPADAETASVGGFGIHLLRTYANTLSYASDGGTNRLELTVACRP